MACSATCVVWMARISSDSCTAAGRSPAAFISSPASRASPEPRSLSGTSVHPVNRFSTFHVLWPWRSRINRPGFLPVAIDLCGDLDDVRELLGVEAGAADEHTVAQ